MMNGKRMKTFFKFIRKQN